MTHFPGWTRHDTPEPPDRRRTRLGRDAPSPARANTDALLVLGILSVAALTLLCLAFGDALAGWAGVR